MGARALAQTARVQGARVQGAKVQGAKVPGARVQGAAPDHSHRAALELDRLLHDHMRLGIVSALAAGDGLSFTELKVTLDATDGNLSVHARKLEDAGYVACAKTFAGRTPRTDYKLTPAGRRALEKYLDHMEAIIKANRRG